jgi:hypothetical protein
MSLARQVAGGTLTAFFSAIIIFFTALVVLVKAPIWEGKLLPVVKDVQVTLIKEDRDAGYQEFSVIATKVRSCEAKGILVLVGDRPDGPLRRVFFALKETPNTRARGMQTYDGIVVGDLGNYIRVDTVHRCHGLWDTVMSPWTEWKR